MPRYVLNHKYGKNGVSDLSIFHSFFVSLQNLKKKSFKLYFKEMY